MPEFLPRLALEEVQQAEGYGIVYQVGERSHDPIASQF